MPLYVRSNVSLKRYSCCTPMRRRQSARRRLDEPQKVRLEKSTACLSPRSVHPFCRCRPQSRRYCFLGVGGGERPGMALAVSRRCAERQDGDRVREAQLRDPAHKGGGEQSSLKRVLHKQTSGDGAVVPWALFQSDDPELVGDPPPPCTGHEACPQVRRGIRAAATNRSGC